jgi:hypothetical protein
MPEDQSTSQVSQGSQLPLPVSSSPSEAREVKTTVRVDKSLLDAMQKVVKDSSGKLRGAQNEAFTESIRLWLAYFGNKPALLVVDKAVRKHVVSADGLIPLLKEVMQDATKLEFSIYPVSSSSQNFEDGIIDMVVKALIARVGRPPVIRIGGQGVGTTVLDTEDQLEERLQSAQEKSDAPLELSLVYPERDLYASFRFDLIEVRRLRQAPTLDFERLGL